MKRPPVALLWVWASLAFPSWSVVDKWLHLPGVIGYTVATALALLMAPRLFTAIPQRATRALGALTLLCLTVVFLWVYPIVNTHAENSGSDDDDAHNVGVAALLDGQSPYSRVTYLGNSLHQLPGSFVLAAPFALIWTSALQNLFWLPLFFLVVRREVSERRTPLVLAWLVLGLSPAVLHALVTGSSYSTNAISVLLAMWWLLRTPLSTLAALAFGLALCSRPNFWFLVPLVFAWLGREAGWHLAIRQMAIAGAVVAGSVLPLYIVSPDFGPLDAWDRLGRYDALVPFAGIAIVMAMGAIAIGLSCVRVDRAGLFRYCALVLAFPVVVSLILSCALDGYPDFTIAAYGSFASWFALMAVATDLESWLTGGTET